MMKPSPAEVLRERGRVILAFDGEPLRAGVQLPIKDDRGNTGSIVAIRESTLEEYEAQIAGLKAPQNAKTFWEFTAD